MTPDLTAIAERIDKANAQADTAMRRMARMNLVREDAPVLLACARELEAENKRLRGEAPCPHCDDTGAAVASNAAGDEWTCLCCCEAGKRKRTEAKRLRGEA